MAVEDGDLEEEEVGGLFKVSRPEKGKRLRADAMDCSRFELDASHDWDQEEVSLWAWTETSNPLLNVIKLGLFLRGKKGRKKVFCYCSCKKKKNTVLK